MSVTPPQWIKSTFCGNATCVEVTDLDNGGVLLRDSKHPEIEPLMFTEDEWDAFLAGVKAGEFD